MENGANNAASQQPVKKKSKLWLIIVLSVVFIALIAGGVVAMFWFNQSVSLDFSASDEVLRNPLIGYSPEAGYSKAVQDTTLVYVAVTWRELEPEEGKFDFDAIAEKHSLSKHRANGKHVVFRFVCDMPGDGEHLDIPDWLYEKINHDGTMYNVPYGQGFSPNYENTTFIEYHAKAIKALGEHYGDDTFISYIELGSLGHWGEWHVYYQGGISKIPKASVRLKYITPYLEAFPNAKILMRRPFNDALVYNFGVFNDMAGHPTATEEWLDWINNGGDYSQADEENALAAMPNAWKTAPMGGEFTSDYPFSYMFKQNYDQTVKQIEESHISFLGPKCPHGASESGGSDVKEESLQLLNHIGYRFHISSAKVTYSDFRKTVTLALKWNNVGSAPIYWNWETYIYVLDQDDNILEKYPVDIKLTELCDGKVINTKNVISLGDLYYESYKLCVGIVDPMTSEPAVYIATDLPRSNTLSIIYEGK